RRLVVGLDGGDLEAQAFRILEAKRVAVALYVDAFGAEPLGPEVERLVGAGTEDDRVHHAASGSTAPCLRILEERKVTARAPLFVRVEEVVDGGVVLVHGLLDEPQPEHAHVEVDVAGRIGRDAGDVVDPLEAHRRLGLYPGSHDLRVSLTARLRPAAAEPEGALALFHGRGADEHDLFPLLDALDPERRLVGATARGPLSLPPGGAHWYVLGGIGTPEATTFDASYSAASEWLDGVLREHGVGHDRLVLGGFSQGGVMAYSLGLGKGRARPAGIIALSSFLPTVAGF